LSPGDLIITSGHGGIYPQGLPIGVVAGEIEGQILAQTFVDWRKITFVRVIDLGGKGLPATPAGKKNNG
jgi:rod shape-determining protein MreC